MNPEGITVGNTEKSVLTKNFLDCMFEYSYPNPTSPLRKTLITVPEKSDMATTITLPSVSSLERNQLLAADYVRRRALERLYERRETVKTLIAALEEYERSRETRLAQCVAITSASTSRSGFSRSQI